MRTHSRSRSERGNALLYATFGAFVLAGLGSMMMSVQMTLSSTTQREVVVRTREAEARFLAEGGLAAAKEAIATALAGLEEPPAAGTVNVQGTAVAYTIRPTGERSAQYDPTGVETIRSAYEVRAHARVGTVESEVERLVIASATPLFQHGIFHHGELELHPAESLVVDGRVHVNGNLHLGAGGSLHLDTHHLRAAGSILRARREEPSRSGGKVWIRTWVRDPFDLEEPRTFVQLNGLAQMAQLGIRGAYDSTFASGHDADQDGDLLDAGDWLPWAQGALSYWGPTASYEGGRGHTVMDRAHGVQPLQAPVRALVQAYVAHPGGDQRFDPATGEHLPCPPREGTHRRGLYHRRADLVVHAGEGGRVSAFDRSGRDLTAQAAAAFSKGSLGAGRGEQVELLRIDLAQLANSGVFPANGLLYVTHGGPPFGAPARGTLLHRGSELSGPLTVATDGALFVQGDFNTGAWRPAALVADSVHVLSNAWGAPRGTPADTRCHAAILTGSDPGGAGSLEQMVRLHEGWAGGRLTLRGSLASAWPAAWSAVPAGVRGTGARPTWSFERRFLDAGTLPPATPMVVGVHDVPLARP